MDNRSLLFGLHEMGGIGWKTILQLISHTIDLQRIWKASAEQLIEMGIQPSKAEVIVSHLNSSFIEQKLQMYERANIHFVTIFDEEYPQLLKQTSQPPWVLYWRGQLSLLNRPLLGMVGTRTPTTYGKKVADDLSFSLSNAGFAIVSGLARGIDSSAHQGALRGQAKTIGVLGCAINQIYPPENEPLYKQIETEGLLISEYPMGTPLHPGMFPIRNRIIAGLSLGVIVVEAAVKSGSLITVDQALEESRDVYAVPGPITSPKSQGVLSLIKQGSKIVTCAEDIIEEYRYLLPDVLSLGDQHLAEVELSADERTIYQLLSAEATSIDRLIELSQFNFGHLHSVLLSLLIKNKISQLPGSAYIAL